MILSLNFWILCEESALMYILGKYSTQILLVLHLVPIFLQNNFPIEILPLGLCIIDLLLLNRESFPRTILNPNRRVLRPSSTIMLDITEQCGSRT